MTLKVKELTVAELRELGILGYYNVIDEKNLSSYIEEQKQQGVDVSISKAQIILSGASIIKCGL